MGVQELELVRELTDAYADAEREWDEIWAPIVALDPNLGHQGIQWYLIPGIALLSENQTWRRQGELAGVVDAAFEQPAASTSTVRRIVLENGSTRIIKEFDPDHPVFYTGSAVAQALTLAGEQLIGGFQYAPGLKKAGEAEFYQGIYSLNQDENRVSLKPYEFGDEDRVVSLMREVDSKKTLGLLMFSERGPSQARLQVIYAELVVRAMRMNVPMPSPLREYFGSQEYIEARIFEHTPGRLANRKIGGQFDWLQDEASYYVERASYVLYQDRELLSYLLSEEYARRGGDVRAINTILNENGSVDVVLDQVSLLLDRKAMGAEDWQEGRLDIAPWGMNSPTYDVAFLLPDLIASGNEEIAQAVVEGLGEYLEDFRGADWEDLSSTPIRALRFWTAMKAIETAGLSTFRFNAQGKMKDENAGSDEQAYLLRTIETYGRIALDLVQGLEQSLA